MAVKILELCRVAPPQGSTPPSALLPLTTFDLIWLVVPISTQRVFLYHAPHCSTSAFLSADLPNLKRSLSLALKRFYPLAGRLVQHNTDPYILYSDGDSVALTVAECDVDLQELTSHQPKDAARLRSLVPSTLPTSGTDRAVLALQATLFPNQGIAIGITVLHAAIDGSSTLHFLRTWASICRSEVSSSSSPSPSPVEDDLPFFDRSVILEYNGLRDAYLSRIEDLNKMGRREMFRRDEPDLVLATFPLSKKDVDKLRTWVASKAPNNTRCSSFTLAAALVWTSLHRAGYRSPREVEGFAFAVDCRVRLDPRIPPSYFGNCITGCLVEMERSRLVGEEGVVAASVAISEAIRMLGVEGFLQKELEVDYTDRYMLVDPFSVAGSPRIGAYKVDFGLGRPSKCEVVSIDQTGAMSLSENGDEAEGGLEIGLALPPAIMDRFTNLFSATLSLCPPA